MATEKILCFPFHVGVATKYTDTKNMGYDAIKRGATLINSGGVLININGDEIGKESWSSLTRTGEGLLWGEKEDVFHLLQLK